MVDINFINKVFKRLKQIQNKHLPSSSLQFRLTLGTTTASILGLGGVAVWTSWTMQQLLVVTHTQNVEYIAERFPHDVKIYGEMLPPETAVQRAVLQVDNSVNANVSAPKLFIWVKRPDGTLLAQSPGLSTVGSEFTTRLMALSAMPIQPRVYRVSSQYMVLCSNRLTINGTMLGQLYMAQDITEEQVMLIAILHQVTIATILTIGLLTIAIAIYVRQALQPLRHMSQLVGSISASDLSQARLSLDQAPDEVKELAETFDDMLSRLSQSWEQQRQFVSNVSHELRTPLTVVYGYLQSVLRRGATLSDPQREALEISVVEAERTIRLLQDLLDLARTESGYMHFQLESVVLNDLVEEVIEMAKKYSDRQIELEAEQQTIWVKTDHSRLKQVLLNLIDNAVKYSDPPEPVLIKLSQTEECAIIQVSDRGCGIPLQNQARIFERFYRVHEDRSRATGGVGLGLSIVKSLVEGMGGKVTVWSEPNQGSTFTITISSVSQTYDTSHSPG